MGNGAKKQLKHRKFFVREKNKMLCTYLSKEKREWDKISPVQAFANLQIMKREIKQNFRLC